MLLARVEAQRSLSIEILLGLSVQHSFPLSLVQDPSEVGLYDLDKAGQNISLWSALTQKR